MVRKIGLVNHMGFGNLGDDATQVAVVKQIKRRWPDAEITLFSMNPADSHSRHGLASYPIRAEFCNRSQPHIDGSSTRKTKVKNALRRLPLFFKLLRTVKAITVRLTGKILDELLFVTKSFVRIKSFEVLIISGGGQLLDSWGGPWKFPYTVFKWTLLAKISLAKCYFLNVGAGPLDHPLAKWFVRSALHSADYVSFRDADSRKLVEKIGFTGKSQVSADCVCILDPPESLPGAVTSHAESIVGLSPMAYCDPRVYWQKDQAVYERFIHSMASFGAWLCQNDYPLVLFSTDIWFDSRAIEEVKALLLAMTGDLKSNLITHEHIAALDQLLSQMLSVNYVVTCRFHGVVFAHLLNKPVLALSHHPKVSTLMHDLGLKQYCLDIRNCDVDSLKGAFLSLVQNQDDIKSRMASKLMCYRNTVFSQFNELFPTVNSSGRG